MSLSTFVYPLVCASGFQPLIFVFSSYPQAASYASSPNPAPFLTYFEATTPASPAKHARLRTALFLQISSMYDPSAAGALLGPHAPLLAPELAIIASKVRAQPARPSCVSPQMTVLGNIIKLYHLTTTAWRRA
jgi:hypothetical protein